MPLAGAGCAAGCHGWTGDEVGLRPVAVWQSIGKDFDHMRERGQVLPRHQADAHPLARLSSPARWRHFGQCPAAYCSVLCVLDSLDFMSG